MNPVRSSTLISTNIVIQNGRFLLNNFLFCRLIDPNYRKSVLCAAIADTGAEEWDFALERYLSTDLSTEKEMLLYALSCSTQPQALNTY